MGLRAAAQGMAAWPLGWRRLTGRSIFFSGQLDACNRWKPLLELWPSLQHPSRVFGTRRGDRDARGGNFSVSVAWRNRLEQKMYDLPWWVMGVMLLAVIGLIVLLIYLRKKDKDS
jgi:hypothetical protein